jgi:hypothetical protein
MHRSRFFGLFADTPKEDAAQAVAFWAAALGSTPPTPAEDDPYWPMPGALGKGLTFEVQAIDGEPRYHVDIETDDVAAETARLKELGATEVNRQPGWVVLRAPGGHLLCVVPVQSGHAVFDARAKTWPDTEGRDG